MSRSKRLRKTSDPRPRLAFPSALPDCETPQVNGGAARHGAPCCCTCGRRQRDICSPIWCPLRSDAHPSMGFLSRTWLLTVGIPSVDCRKRQTATASPAEPGGLPLTLGDHCF